MVLAEQQGVSIKKTVLELDVGGNLPLGPGEIWLLAMEVAALNLRTNEEVGRDIVAFRYVIAIAQLVECAFSFQIDVLDVVLNGVLSVGELFVERNTKTLNYEKWTTCRMTYYKLGNTPQAGRRQRW